MSPPAAYWARELHRVVPSDRGTDPALPTCSFGRSDRVTTSIVPPRWSSLPQESDPLEFSSRSMVFPVDGARVLRVWVLPRTAPEARARAWADRYYPGWGSYATLYLWRKLVTDLAKETKRPPGDQTVARSTSKGKRASTE